MRILCVCHGNLCRSPMAEAVLRRHLSKRGLDVEVASAGVRAWYEGNPPDARGVAVAARRGYDISRNEARKVRVEDFHAFDFILAMDRSNLRLLEALAPDPSRARIALFHPAGREIADPYYGGEPSFERAFTAIDDAAARRAEHLAAETFGRAS